MTVIDPQVFTELQQAAGADFVDELVDTFLEDAPALLRAMHEAAERGDAPAFRRAAHSLKSNASSFGAQALAACARELEHRGLAAPGADDEDDEGPLAAALSQLAHELHRAAAALSALRHG